MMTRDGRRHLRLFAFRRDDSGVAAVEFVLIAPVVMAILVALVDFGTLLYTRFQLDAAVSAAANYALVNASNVNSTNGSSLASTLSALVASSQGSGWANSSVTVNDGPAASTSGGVTTSSGSASPADSCYCPTGSAPSPTWGGAQTCGASCAGGGYAGKFVLVSASRSYSPIISGYGFAAAGTISTSSMVQVQ